MPRNATFAVPAEDWVELTNGDVTDITFQNQGKSFVLVLATVGSVKPATPSGALRYNPGQGERYVPLSELFPGVAGATRVWAYAETPGSVAVSHA